MPRGDQPIEHLLRRAGFGASVSELQRLGTLSQSALVSYLIDFGRERDDVDAHIGSASYAGVSARSGQFSPNTNIEDARQRWLFRMVHSQRPLQEKMALFWHQHFATGYAKIAGVVGGVQATKMLNLVGGEFPGPPGQLEVFRSRALGKFRDLLVEVARGPAMLVWLDGHTNTRTRPQENFGRELMELFTVGIGQYAEQDVYTAARVFTGWSLRLNAGGSNDQPNSYYEFAYNPDDHDTSAKTFTFPVSADGSTTLRSRAAADGMQEGLDLIAALARSPATARRLARRLWSFFVSELESAPDAFVEELAQVYLRTDTDMRAVVDALLRSVWFSDPRYAYARYAWPVEFVARAIRETGWTGLSLDTARAALPLMGQQLFEPPDVGGWETGASWISTGTMLARMNFATALAANQKTELGSTVPDAARAAPDRFVDAMLERLSPMAYTSTGRSVLTEYASAGASWPLAEGQLSAKAAGLARLILGSAEYQFV